MGGRADDSYGTTTPYPANLPRNRDQNYTGAKSPAEPRITIRPQQETTKLRRRSSTPPTENPLLYTQSRTFARRTDLTPSRPTQRHALKTTGKKRVVSRRTLVSDDATSPAVTLIRSGRLPGGSGETPPPSDPPPPKPTH